MQAKDANRNDLKNLLMPNLIPNVIFVDRHDDPITQRILLRLTPELRKLGYQAFFAELPHMTPEQFIEEAKKKEAILLEYKKLAAQWGFNIFQEEELVAFIFKITDQTKGDYVNLYLEIKRAIMMSTHEELFIKLLSELRNNNIKFSGIDMNTEGMSLQHVISEEVRDKRNRYMADRYIASNVPVFGFIGVTHLEGMQKYLNDSSNYCFFYVYTNSISKDFSEKEAKLLPIEPSFLDANKMKEEEIVSFILNKVKSIKEKNQLARFAALESKASSMFAKLDKIVTEALRDRNLINDEFEETKQSLSNYKPSSFFLKPQSTMAIEASADCATMKSIQKNY